MVATDISGTKTEREINTGEVNPNSRPHISSNFNMDWIRIHPIEIHGEVVNVSPLLMEIGKPYRFIWGGVEVFAIRRTIEDKVDFYTTKQGKNK